MWGIEDEVPVFLLAGNRKECILLDGLALRILLIHMAKYESHLLPIPELQSSFELSKPEWTARGNAKSLIMLFLWTCLALISMADANQRIHEFPYMSWHNLPDVTGLK